ncbi:hypothetical protein [Lactobacillus sp.]|uniref:hypothetical protein n=1 Tax=Lactobacillus sp. TaxID=1591 RepID=UPI0019A84986|nr:hypothetical protein [Lactobacillus sp.]MBD5429236.1 hypothetical protein [Lactobacillus sp.]
MLVPLASRSQTVHAAEWDKPWEPGLIPTYGIAPNEATGKGGSGSKLGVDLGGTAKKKGYGSVDGKTNAENIHKDVLTGYLQLNKNISGQPIGSNGKKFRTSKEGDGNVTWVVYTQPSDSDAGKVGMYYKKALTYYPNMDNKTNKGKSSSPITLDAYLIWNGSYRPGENGSNNNLQFSTKNISVKEPYQGAANFTLILYDSKTGRKFKKIKPQIMQTDIDYKQGLIFNTP